MGNPSAARLFEYLTIGGKGGLILFLLVLALINGHADYVTEKPRKFMKDAVATGFFGALAAVLLCLTRGRSDLIANHFIFALMLFFLYAVCREFAGYFAVFGEEKMSAAEEKQTNILKKPIIIFGAIGLIAAIGLAAAARVAPDFSRGIFKSLPGWKIPFAIETILFALIVSMGEIVVAGNHDEHLNKAFIMSMGMFIFANIVLQSGGFYKHLYSAPPPCIQ